MTDDDSAIQIGTMTVIESFCCACFEDCAALAGAGSCPSSFLASTSRNGTVSSARLCLASNSISVEGDIESGQAELDGGSVAKVFGIGVVRLNRVAAVYLKPKAGMSRSGVYFASVVRFDST